MIRAKSIFLHLILTISATSVCASDPEYGTGSKTLLKPSAEIPDKVMRNFSGRKTGRYYFGALAINPAMPTDFFATQGLNSTQAAAAIAKIGSELNSRHTQTCEVVAVSVPQDASTTFTQSMSLSAVEPICKGFWQDLRKPNRRGRTIFRGCSAVFIRPEGDSTAETASNPGHRLYVARNDLYSTVITYGANAAHVKEIALKGCTELHSSFLKRLNSGAMTWKDPGKRVRNRRELEVEQRAILAYVAANPARGKCRIVSSEILP